VNGSGYSLRGTPVAQDDQKSPEAHLAMKQRMPGGPRSAVTSLTVQAKTWQTPTTSEAEGSGMRSGDRNGEPKLQGQAKMWPTPRAHDGTAGGDQPSTHPQSGGEGLLTASRRHPTTTTPGNDGPPKADLNPNFVAALMGVPQGWLNPSISVATDSYRKWLLSHSIDYSNG
jgi:hypothetical protein